MNFCRYENITAFTKAYHHEVQLYLVHENVLISLAEIQSKSCNDSAFYEFVVSSGGSSGAEA